MTGYVAVHVCDSCSSRGPTSKAPTSKGRGGEGREGRGWEGLPRLEITSGYALVIRLGVLIARAE